MKKIFFILVLVIAGHSVFAQNDSCFAGVYLTKNDLVNDHLSYKVNLSENGNKLKFPPVADWKLEVKIVTPTQTYKFPAGTIYGYSQCGRVYRYSPGGSLYSIEDFYRIEEVGSLVIYTSVFNSGSEYFYSKDLSSPVRRLNLWNLKGDFPGQHSFIHHAKKLKRDGVHGGLAMQNSQGKFIINNIYISTIKE
ncbi:MAG TPA: hypothetical protein VN721_15665 [Flavipsychrobacter sp.]|nr:hypothetical protein [Flavipsychrobacter sp.]